MNEFLRLIEQHGMSPEFERFVRERTGAMATPAEIARLAQTYVTMHVGGSASDMEVRGLLTAAGQTEPALPNRPRGLLDRDAGGMTIRERIGLLGQSAEDLGRGVASGALRGVTSVTSGLFDLFGADEVAEGIRRDRDAVAGAIGPEQEPVPGIAGQALGELATMLVPFVGTARAGAAAAKLLRLGKLGTRTAEGVASAPLAAAIATDPELSFFAALPEGQRVAFEGAIEIAMGPAFTAAAVPFRLLRQGGGEAIRLRRFGPSSSMWAKTGVRGEEARRLRNDPSGARDRANFYIAGTGEPEQFAGIRSAEAVHEVDIPLDRMYSAADDPDGIIARKRHELGNLDGTNYNRVEDALAEAGYLGYYESGNTGDLATRAVVFDTPEARRVLSDVETRPNPLLPKNIDRAADAMDVARRYAESIGLDHSPQAPLKAGDVDEAYHTRIAQMYDEAVSQPTNPEVIAAYEALEQEVRDQFEWLTRSRLDGGAGIKVIFTEDDPYKTSAEMMQDITENGRLKVFASTADHHPLLSAEANNMLRADHDYWGHFAQQNNFAAHGEESAARMHSVMFSDAARPAMLTETRGQNSWFSFGPHRGLAPRDRPFAEQKVFLMEEWANGPEYVTPPPRVMTTRMDETVAKAHGEFGGSTFDAKSGANMVGQDKWAVAAGEPVLLDRPPTPEDIARFRAEHADALSEEGATVATWNNRTREDGTRIREGDEDFAHGKHELNVGRGFDSQDDARAFGTARGEHSILNLADPEFEAVRLDDEIGQAMLRARLDETVPARTEARASAFMASLTPTEAEAFAAMPARSQEDALRSFSLTTSARQGASIAILGAQAQRWYDASADSIVKMFGFDAPRFTALLAATSANAPVDNNLRSALRVWGEWDKAGRPADADEIKRIFETFGQPEGAVPNAVDNAITSLTASEKELMSPKFLDRFTTKGDPSLLHPDRKLTKAGRKEPSILSGPKVDPFYANLMGNTQRITQDTHMLRGAGALPELSKARKLAMNASTRAAAKQLSEITGTTVTPREVQAMQWTVFKALSEEIGTVRNRKTIGAALEEIAKEPGGITGGIRRRIEAMPSYSSLLSGGDEATDEILDLYGMGRVEFVPDHISPEFDPALIREADVRAIVQRMEKFERAGQKGATEQFLFQLTALAAAGAAATATGEEELLLAGMIPGGRRLDWNHLGKTAARAARTLGREAGLTTKGLTPETTADVARLQDKGQRFLPGFFDEVSGQAYPTGIAHDPMAVTDPALQRRMLRGGLESGIVDGFYDTETGRFLTREETAMASGAMYGESTMVEDAMKVTSPDDLQATVLAPDGTLYRARFHGEAMNEAVADGHKIADLEQGFTTPGGQFFNRDEAAARFGVRSTEDIAEQALLSEEIPESAFLTEQRPGGLTPGMQDAIDDLATLTQAAKKRGLLTKSPLPGAGDR